MEFQFYMVALIEQNVRFVCLPPPLFQFYMVALIEARNSMTPTSGSFQFYMVALIVLRGDIDLTDDFDFNSTW